MAGETVCIWCGARILWIPGAGGKQIPVEARFTPYRRTERNNPDVLFTGAGGRIPCEILPEDRDREATGFAHRYHACPKKPVFRKRKPLTRKEKYREMME